MKKTILSLLLVLLPLAASAETVEIGGIYYNLVTKLKTAEVINPYIFAYYAGSVIIPDTVTYNDDMYNVISIGEGAFSYSNGFLTSITIPNSVTSIGDLAFNSCFGLTSVTIPNSVTSIGNSAFAGCTGLTKVTIPNSVTNISNLMFSGCSALMSITIPNSITIIGSSAFKECIGLSSFNIPNSVISIGSSAFASCRNLRSVTIGNGIKNIYSNAFASCSELTDVYCYAKIVPNTSSDAFQDSYIEYATLHVPASAIDSYKAKSPWNTFKSIVSLDGSTPEVKTCATPTISYINGKLKFTCDTEGAEFVSEVTVADAKKYYDAEVPLTGVYHVSVFATKTGYDNSDVATADFVVIGSTVTLVGDVDGNGKIDATDITKLIDILLKR